jgi:transcriptional regulator with XRE-family HTH domain
MAKSAITIRFGKTLREYREAKGYSQEELAERANLHRNYVGSVERGERNVALENIVKLAKRYRSRLAISSRAYRSVAVDKSKDTKYSGEVLRTSSPFASPLSNGSLPKSGSSGLARMRAESSGETPTQYPSLFIRGPMKRIAISIASLVFVCFLAIQIYHPAISKVDSGAEIIAPENAEAVLRKDCYSCHSNQARLEWFDQVQPAYFLVRKDVLDARQRLNFSTLGSKPVAAQKANCGLQRSVYVEVSIPVRHIFA